METRPPGRRNPPPPHLQHAPQLRNLDLAAGVSLFTLSRRMGTSLAMIDATYGHLAPDAEEQERLLLDAYDRSSRPARESFQS
jgi:hypothetical protein